MGDFKKMKKGQLFGEGFKIIFILVLIGFSLFFGFKMIQKMMDYSEEIQFNTFLVDLRGEIDKVGVLDKGSSILLNDLNLPGDLTEVCFFNGSLNSLSSYNWDNVDNKLFKGNLEIYANLDREFNTYFYIDEGDIKYDTLDFLLDDSLSIPVCVDTSEGVLDVILVNEGDGVYLSVH